MQQQSRAQSVAATAIQEGALRSNRVLRNTYLLLSMTLLFSAATAALSMALALPPMTYLVSVGVAFVLGIFVLPRTANSAAGIGVIFGITGLLGLGLGPLLNIYLSLPKGPETIATAMGGTGVIFLGLSAYALNSRRDFSFLGGFLFAGFMVVLIAALANIFLGMPALSLAVSSAIILLMSGFILFDTSRIVNGGETNYIMATYGLYLSIFNLFINLLSLLGIMGDD
ncbi:MAG: Bax inhibitor-1/YccA family protein [Gammaproteobacteria bacterium]|nr:MAG: Bax inhibitor-1/YccA family protein [Gammaproteobacteria bacterium]